MMRRSYWERLGRDKTILAVQWPYSPYEYGAAEHLLWEVTLA